MTIAETENIYIKRLAELYHLEEAKNLFYFAVEHVCGMSKPQAILRKSANLSQMDETSLTIILDELETGKPIQYVLGETQFYGLRLEVNSSVLIPRPETEELVDWVLKEANRKGDKVAELALLDIGTGSGCIPVALKKYLPDAQVMAMDISDSALETAMKNAVRNGTDIKFIQDDILKPKCNYAPQTFDVIVSNPPYITAAEQEDMHLNVLNFEPHNALFVPDSNPLIFYAAIMQFAQSCLKDGGLLFFEINEQFGKDLVKLLSANRFLNIELRKDLMRKDRMIKGEKMPTPPLEQR